MKRCIVCGQPVGSQACAVNHITPKALPPTYPWPTVWPISNQESKPKEGT